MNSKAALLGRTALVHPAVIIMAATSIEDLIAERDELQSEATGLMAVTEDGGDLTDEQAERAVVIANEIKRLDKQITARQSLTASAGRKAKPEPTPPANGPRIAPIEPRPRNRDPRGGFENFGEFAKLVRASTGQGVQPDARLMDAATSYGNESVGADGGFLVPPEFARDLWKKVEAEENLLNRCEELIVGGNSMSIPKDETTPWQSTGGIQVFWEGEGQAMTASKPAFELSTFRLVRLTALVPIGDDNLDDAMALESWLKAKAPAKMASKINTAIVDGTGAGMPLGILRAPSTISVAKEVSQPADTIWAPNIHNMWARVYAPWRRNAIWLINQDIEPQLDSMAFDPKADSKVPVYLPAGGLSASPYATLKGRPVVPVEACKTLGDKGDIILVDLKQYWALKKAAGVRTDTSIHLYFDQALTTFRFIFRMNGQPAWSAPIMPENGNQTRSWAVTLDERN